MVKQQRRSKRKKFEQKDGVVQKKSSIVQNTYEYGIIKLKKYFFVLSIFIFIVLIFGKPEENKAQTSDEAALIKIRKEFSEKMDKQKPKILFLGNSIIRDGFSDSIFTNLSKINVTRHSPGGSGTAEWYLYLKNVFFNVKNNHTDLIVITFRDKQMTSPMVGTKGGSKLTIDRLSTSSEPLYDRLVLNNNMDIFSYFFYKRLNILQKRNIIKKDFETRYKNQIAKFTNDYKENGVDSVIENFFKTDNLNINLLTQIELQENNDKNEFNSLLSKSFLPYILKLIKDNNKELIFVRYKRRKNLVPDSKPGELKEYISDLQSYLQKNDILLIDFTNNEIIKKEHFKNGDHYNENGRILFTNLIYEKLSKNCSNFTNQSVQLRK